MKEKVVFEADNVAEATMVQTILIDAGVNAAVFDQPFVGAFPLFTLPRTKPTVVVDEKQWETAKSIVEEYKISKIKDIDRTLTVTDAEGQFDWPRCPECDSMRRAICQNCGQTGTDFLAQDRRGAATDNIYVCQNCGETTEMKYESRCKFCGCVINAELEVRLPGQALETLSTKITFVVFAAVFLMVAVLLIWMLLS